VVEALSARIEQLVQEAKTEDQEAVVTELRAHEQCNLGKSNKDTTDFRPE
jgi:hypothetical protein